MPETTLQVVFRLMGETFQDLPRIASAAAKEGAIDVLRGMVDAGIVKPSGDDDLNVKFFASVLPILDTHPDRAAAQKLVDEVRAAFGGFDADIFARGFALLHDPELIRPMIGQGADLHARLEEQDDPSRCKTVLGEMMHLSRLQCLQKALDILAERDEIPLAGYTGLGTDQDAVPVTLFERLLDLRNIANNALEITVLEHLADRQQLGTMPRSWSIAIGRALFKFAQNYFGVNQSPERIAGMLQQQDREPAILRMTKLAVFEDPADWLALLSATTRVGKPLSRYLVSNARLTKDAVHILAASTRDGLHPDLVVSTYGANAPYTWLLAALDMNIPEMTRALLECGADPYCKPEEGSLCAAERAQHDGSTESAQAINSWLARQSITKALEGAYIAARKLDR